MNLFDYQKKILSRNSRGIHSYLHSVVKEICDYLGVKEFGLWLGVGKRIGVDNLRTKFEYMKNRDIRSSRYLLVCCKNGKSNRSAI